MTYKEQLDQLQRNADAMIAKAKRELSAEFASIDRAHAIKAANRNARPISLGAPSIHDLCANNPLLRKIIRDMQR